MVNNLLMQNKGRLGWRPLSFRRRRQAEFGRQQYSGNGRFPLPLLTWMSFLILGAVRCVAPHDGPQQSEPVASPVSTKEDAMSYRLLTGSLMIAAAVLATQSIAQTTTPPGSSAAGVTAVKSSKSNTSDRMGGGGGGKGAAGVTAVKSSKSNTSNRMGGGGGGKGAMKLNPQPEPPGRR
jgi:hypothetical protein